MVTMKTSTLPSVTFLSLMSFCSPVQGDEGMWLLNGVPRELLKSKYGFEVTDEWLERAQKASVRFNNGGSGSFVSPEGLLLTNHHIGAEMIQKVSPPDKDYYKLGFSAKTRAEELKCPDLELNVLQTIEDVTARVNAAVKPEMSPPDAFAARRAVMAEIEKESLDKTGQRSDVVTLYNGGLYHLYRYKKYTDVRLVFAPEHQIAFFGGDTDNFEYPRFNLDICFFRAYENDQPAKPTHWLKWSEKGPGDGDLVFVTGHPGTTQRLETLAQLEHRRDFRLPYSLGRLRAFEAALIQFSEKGLEQRRMAATDLHRVANSRKAFSGQYQGLLDPAILAVKAAQEKKLQQTVLGLTGDAEPDQSDAKLAPWTQLAEVQKKLKEFELEYNLLEMAGGFFSELFDIARHVNRLPVEVQKPDGNRLREYRDSNLESLKFKLYSPAPIHAELERTKLTASLTYLAERLGGAHPFVVQVLAGKNPANRASELVAGTKLFDPEVRKALVEGGPKAVDESSDTMVALARLVDPESRKYRKRYEDEVEEIERQAHGKIAEARFQAFGKEVAPDATFTLRMAFGTVRGYSVDGVDLAFHTTFGEAFAREAAQEGREPFDLPPRWKEGKDKVDPKTPFNFCSTADTIGGNSGSPVLNRDGELVGVNFDRNRHGLVRNFVYTDEQARHIAVHSAGILEAMRKLYDAQPIIDEILKE